MTWVQSQLFPNVFFLLGLKAEGKTEYQSIENLVLVRSDINKINLGRAARGDNRLMQKGFLCSVKMPKIISFLLRSSKHIRMLVST